MVVVLMILWGTGAMTAEMSWTFLHQPGKDPQREMSTGGLIGFISVGAAVAWALFHRGWHYIP